MPSLGNLKKLSLSSLHVDDIIADFFPVGVEELDLARTSVSGVLIDVVAKRGVSVHVRELCLSYTGVTSYQQLVPLSCMYSTLLS